MNHVNLIGNISSKPRVVELTHGRKIAHFTVSTKETFLDDKGNTKNRKQWHRMTAWGRWVKVLEELGAAGIPVAVEGKLVSRFYSDLKGGKQYISEVEVNDLVLL
jgi:single-strand DNA-binding protein